MESTSKAHFLFIYFFFGNISSLFDIHKTEADQFYASLMCWKIIAASQTKNLVSNFWKFMHEIISRAFEKQVIKIEQNVKRL